MLYRLENSECVSEGKDRKQKQKREGRAEGQKSPPEWKAWVRRGIIGH